MKGRKDSQTPTWRSEHLHQTEVVGHGPAEEKWPSLTISATSVHVLIIWGEKKGREAFERGFNPLD